MTTSTTKSKYRQFVRKLLFAALWIGVWQLASMLIAQEILLVSPVVVAKRIIELSFEPSFWSAAFNSIIKIFFGFLIANVLGIILAFIASKSSFFRDLLSPVIFIMKSTPVASFIILALVWINTAYLSTLISFLMVLPIIYTNMLAGVENIDKDILNMANVFKVPAMKKFKYIYIPSLLPYYSAACTLGLGFSWKSGIAAEVIGLPRNTIGYSLYNAKIFLETPDLFALTVVIIIISILFERIFLLFLKLLKSSISKDWGDEIAN